MPKSVRRAPLPKVQRGFQKGKRGPNVSQAEIDERAAARDKQPIIIQTVAQPGNGKKFDGHRPSETGVPPQRSLVTQTQQLNRQLQNMIQEIGKEVVDPQKGWTRIEAAIRRLYVDAIGGKTAAQALLFERGWGRVVQPVKVDFQTELKQLVAESGLTSDEIASDPLLSQLMPGDVIEGEFVSGNAPD